MIFNKYNLLDGKSYIPKLYIDKSYDIDYGCCIINEEYEEELTLCNCCQCPYVLSFKNIPDCFSFSLKTRLYLFLKLIYCL